MKILGKSNDAGFIVYVTMDELQQLMGKGSSMYSEDFRKISAGQEIKMGKCYENAREVLGAYENIKSSVNSLKTSCTKILDFIAAKESPIAPTIKSNED